MDAKAVIIEDAITEEKSARLTTHAEQAHDERSARDNPAADDHPTAHDDLTSATDSGAKKHNRLGMLLKNRYRIESLIASGGMSDVYKAVDLRLAEAGTRDHLVALKILRSSLTQDANALSLLARETAKSKRLSHPNIIRVYDLDHDGDTWFMVMELLEGEPLSRVIQRAKPNGLKWWGARAVLEQVISALDFSHRRGIVHADLKPSNIFFTQDGEVKLLDFGVAQALKPHQQVDFLNPRGEDETSVYGYTPAYASPAVIEGKDPTIEDDLFALACIGYELLSSRHPFERKKLDAAALAKYPLKKPKQMPLLLWRTVKRTLLGQGKKPGLQSFLNAMKPIPWEKYLYHTGLLVTTGMAFIFWYLSYSGRLAVEQKLQDSMHHAESIQQLSNEAPAQLLAALNTLNPLEKAGLLRLQQDALVAHFQQRMDENLQASRPDLSSVLAILAEAKALFPRDQRLLQKGEQLQQQRLSLERALTAELQGRLSQGDYRTDASLKDLAHLKSDMDFIGVQPAPFSKTTVSVFEKQLKTALEANDASSLSRLFSVADLFFSHTPELADRLAEARKHESAILALNHYQAAIAKGGDTLPEFPIAAAEQFYESQLKRWQEAIANAQGAQALDAVYADINRQPIQMPADFKPVETIRQQLADAYIEQADRLLNQNKARLAKPLLMRATELMRK